MSTKKSFLILFSLSLIFLISGICGTAMAAGQQPVPILELVISDRAQVVDHDNGIYVVGTDGGDLYVINEGGAYNVTALGAGSIKDVRIEHPFVAVVTGNTVIELWCNGLNPVEMWRQTVGQMKSIDVSKDGAYVAYLSTASVGVLDSNGMLVDSNSVLGGVVHWLDATDDMEYIAITAEREPYGTEKGVELYRFNGWSLSHQWRSIEAAGVRVSEAKDYVAVATSSGTYMHCLELTDGSILWSHETPNKEQYVCDGDENLNYVIGATQNWNTPYPWFVLKNLGTAYEVIADSNMNGPINDLDSSNDGLLVAFGSDTGEFILLRRSNDSIDTIFEADVNDVVEKLIDAIEIGDFSLLVGGETFINLYLWRGVILEKVDDVNDWDCVAPDVNITYTIDYNNSIIDPCDPRYIGTINDVNIIDYLPPEVDFNSASGPNCIQPDSNTVVWNIGTLHPGDAGSVTLTVKVKECVVPGGTITNECEIKSGGTPISWASEHTPVCCWEGVPVIYVDANANGCDNGTSWEDALTNLQDALEAARNCDCNEIHVAAGSYKPDCNSAYPNGSGDRDATFQLINNVAIYGGFPPGGGVWQARDPNDPNNKTILSGDLNGDDEPNFVNNGDNSYHVVTGSGTDETVILDGFTITSGNAYYSYGGGMYNSGGSPTVTNCTFSGNSAYGGGGGGMYNSGGSPTITNCTFSGNSAGSYAGGGGGGMYNYESSPTITNCTFSGNSTGSAGYGGGMYNSGGSPTVTNCTFSGNSAYRGGGMYNSGGSLTITNCTFSGNSASSGGGGMRNWGSSTITNCTFSGNSAGGGGGGMYNDGSPTVTNCTFSGNSAGWDGGGMYNDGGSPTVTNCTFSGNSAVGGGGMYNDGGSPTVTNCTFSGNSAYRGGGMYSWGSSTLTNCTFSNNSADNTGGGMYDESSPTVTNCTFSGNSAGTSGGGMYNYGSSPKTITNSILWDNRAINDGNEVYNNFGGAEPNFTYCDIRGCKDPNGLWDPNIGLDGGGNIDADPCFVEPGYWGDVNDPNIPVEPNDPNAFWVDGNYRLLSNSPCIDAGDNNSVPPDYADLDGDENITEPTPLDLDGFERFIDDLCIADTGNGTPPIVDMGAYEFLRSDINHNGSVNFVDYALFASQWFQNGCGPSNGWCGGAELACDGDDKVEWADLHEFVGWWLAGAAP